MRQPWSWISDAAEENTCEASSQAPVHSEMQPQVAGGALNETENQERVDLVAE